MQPIHVASIVWHRSAAHVHSMTSSINLECGGCMRRITGWTGEGRKSEHKADFTN